MSASNWCKVKYLDASALVKLYIDENGTKQLRDYFYSNQANFRTTWLCLGEALGILKSKWIGNQSKKVATKIETGKYLEATSSLIIEWRKRIESDDLELVDPSVPLKVSEMAKKIILITLMLFNYLLLRMGDIHP